MKMLFYCCKYLYCEINESEISKKKAVKCWKFNSLRSVATLIYNS